MHTLLSNCTIEEQQTIVHFIWAMVVTPVKIHYWMLVQHESMKGV